MYKYTYKLLPASFENIFKKLGNFERSLNYQLDILKMCSLQYLLSSFLLKMWNNLSLDIKRSLSVYLKIHYFLKITLQRVIKRIAIHVKLIRYVFTCFDICCVHVRKLL